MIKRLLMMCSLGVLATAGVAPAAVITFDDIPAGSFVGAQYFLSHGVLIAADNARPTGPDVATTFNSNQSSPWDVDLVYAWNGGNLNGQRLNNLLSIAENVTDSNGNGLIDRPDDENRGGQLFFTFTIPISSFGLDVIDMEVLGSDGVTPNSFLSTLSFYNDQSLIRTIRFSEFTDPLSPFYDPTIIYGNNTANRIDPVTAEQLGVNEFDAVVVFFNYSHSMDTLDFETVPEPTALSLALALPALAMRRRRRA